MNFDTTMVVCPKCGDRFEHDQINGVALIQAAANIEKQKRMYCTLSLNSIERLDKESNLKYPLVRKIILDNFNDFTRAVHAIIGFGKEAE